MSLRVHSRREGEVPINRDFVPASWNSTSGVGVVVILSVAKDLRQFDVRRRYGSTGSPRTAWSRPRMAFCSCHAEFVRDERSIRGGGGCHPERSEGSKTIR